MLESFKDIQNEFYSMVFSAIQTHKKISHAYLIDTAGCENAESIVRAFAKFIFCEDHFVNNANCNDCKLCSMIDNKSDQHIQEIVPDGLWIKKEQLSFLKDEFSKKSIDGLKQIYIIYEADKLNTSAANSLLKFLEEPEEGIIAILVTNNQYKVLPTILSRCQVYTLKADNTIQEDETYGDLFDFIMNLERNLYHTICYIQDLWHSKYKTKEDFVSCFSKLELVFLDLIHYKIFQKTQFPSYGSDIEYIISKNTEEDLVRKLSKIIECKNQIQYNANLLLLMDKFIIEYLGGDFDD